MSDTATTQTNRTPVIPAVCVERLPNALRRHAHFVEWQYEFDEEAETEDGKLWKKAPLIVGRDGHAGSTNPATWRSYEVAVESYRQRATEFPGSYGLGYVFAKSGYAKYQKIKESDADTFVFVDVDHCFGTDGALNPRAREIIGRLRSYTERSPSKTGLHIYGFGRVPKAYKVGNIEVYEVARYSTLTGDWFEGTPEDVCNVQEGLDWLIGELQAELDSRNGHHRSTGTGAGAGAGTNGPRAYPPVPLTDEELLHKIRDSKQGPLFHALYDNGEWQGRYKSQSEAVWSLLGMLRSWTRCDSDRMDRLFRDSAMMNGRWFHKWDEPYGDTTLGALQIAKMIELPGWVYGSSKLDEEFAEPSPDRFAQDDWSDFWKRPPIEPLVDGFLALGTTGMTFGTYGTGKTAFHDDLCLHVALGRDWMGRAVTRGHVWIVQAEGQAYVFEHFAALFKKYGITEWPPFLHTITRDTPNMLVRSDVELLAQRIREQTPEDGRVVTIRLDTLAQTSPGGKEDNADMTLYVSHMVLLGRLVNDSRFANDPHVHTIHHPGWAGDHSRGGSSLPGAIDTGIKIEVVNGGRNLRRVSCNKQRGGWKEFETFGFRVESVEIDDAGHTGPVIEEDLLPNQIGSTGQLTVRQQQVLTIFLDLYKVSQKQEALVYFSAWESACVVDGVNKNTFKTCAGALVKKGLVYRDEQTGAYFLPFAG